MKPTIKNIEEAHAREIMDLAEEQRVKYEFALRQIAVNMGAGDTFKRAAEKLRQHISDLRELVRYPGVQVKSMDAEGFYYHLEALKSNVAPESDGNGDENISDVLDAAAYLSEEYPSVIADLEDEDAVIEVDDDDVEGSAELDIYDGDGDLHYQLPDIFPNDRGFIYAIEFVRRYTKEEDPPFWQDLSRVDAEHVVKTWKTRRDFPEFLREALRKFVIEMLKLSRGGDDLEAERELPSPLLPKMMNAGFEYIHTSVVTFYERLQTAGLKARFDAAMDTQYGLMKQAGRGALLSDAKNLFKFDAEQFREPGTEKYGARQTWFNQQQFVRFKKLVTSSRDTREASYPLEIFEKMERGTYKPILPLADNTIDVALVALKDAHPLFADVIEFYRAQLRMSLLKGKVRIVPVLMVGNPGIGKTRFCLDLAQAIGTELTISDMSGTTEAWVLTGLRSSWGQARAGLIAEALINAQTLSPIVFLDELDKPASEGRDPRRALYQILEETTAARFVDEFLEVEMDTSQVIYMAAANSLAGIPKPLLSRFKTFQIADPTIEQQKSVLQRIYAAEIQCLDVFQPIISDAVLDKLCTMSMREAKLKIQEAIGSKLLAYSLDAFDQLRGTHSLAIEAHQVEQAPLDELKRKIGF